MIHIQIFLLLNYGIKGMVRRLIILSILLLIVRYTGSHCVYAESNTSNDAYITYKTYFEDESTGFYSKENFIFFIAEVEIASRKVKRSYYEAKAMLLVNDLLKKYIIEGLVLPEKNDIPYEGKLRAKINELFKSGNYVDINISNIRGRIIENWSKNNIYRYVYAVPVHQLEKQRKQLNKNTEDIGFYVYKVFEQAKEEDQYHELMTFYLELGLIEDAMHYQKQILKNKYNLINFYYPKNPFLERKELRKILTYASNNNKNLDTDAINTLPGNFEIITHVINSKYKGDPLASIIFYFTLLPDTPEKKHRVIFERIIENINSLKKYYQSFKEYSLMLQTLRNGMDKSFFEQNDVLAYSSLTLGHLEFDNTLSGKTNQYFEEADGFFQKGINKEKIKQLLLKSISISPRHSDSWNYLGAVLLVDNFVKEALILHTQAYQIDNSNIETIAHIADCYYRLNYKTLANNYAEHLKLLNKNIGNNFVNKIIQKIL